MLHQAHFKPKTAAVLITLIASASAEAASSLSFVKGAFRTLAIRGQSHFRPSSLVIFPKWQPSPSQTSQRGFPAARQIPAQIQWADRLNIIETNCKIAIKKNKERIGDVGEAVDQDADDVSKVFEAAAEMQKKGLSIYKKLNPGITQDFVSVAARWAHSSKAAQREADKVVPQDAEIENFKKSVKNISKDIDDFDRTVLGF